MVHIMKSKLEKKLKIGHELVRAFRITNIYFIYLQYVCERFPGENRNRESQKYRRNTQYTQCDAKDARQHGKVEKRTF